MYILFYFKYIYFLFDNEKKYFLESLPFIGEFFNQLNEEY